MEVVVGRGSSGWSAAAAFVLEEGATSMSMSMQVGYDSFVVKTNSED